MEKVRLKFYYKSMKNMNVTTKHLALTLNCIGIGLMLSACDANDLKGSSSSSSSVATGINAAATTGAANSASSVGNTTQAAAQGDIEYAAPGEACYAGPINLDNPLLPCAPSTLSAVANPATLLEQTQTSLVVKSVNLQNMSYSCLSLASKSAGSTPLSGPLAAGDSSTSITVNEDLNCTVMGTSLAGQVVTQAVSISVTCGNRIKSGGACQDFTCLSMQPISPVDGILNVPARDASGKCYYLQLASSIASGPSNLTTTKDPELMTADHDGDQVNHNPYLMAQSELTFMTNGLRNVKLTGSSAGDASILVDNFVLVGIFPQGSTPVVSENYHAYGTSDSGLIVNNVHSDYILMNNDEVSLTPFGSGGTATVSALDITSNVTGGIVYNLDVRAEDCGGVRNMSNIYLLFQ